MTTAHTATPTTFSVVYDAGDSKEWLSNCGKFSVVQYAQWGVTEGMFFMAYVRRTGARLIAKPVSTFELAAASIPTSAGAA